MPGDVVTETLPFDGGRDVSVYVPSQPPTAIVFAGDGQVLVPWGADLDVAGGCATLVVGVHRVADERARIHEYSPRFEPAKFAAHERFVVDDVRAWVVARFGVSLPAARTAAFGVSASGELALALAMRHPDLFGVVLCASPGGGYQPPAASELASRLPRAYFVAGRAEPFFAATAQRWADALAAAGGEVVMTERDGTHGDPFWRAEFPRMVAWAFATARA